METPGAPSIRRRLIDVLERLISIADDPQDEDEARRRPRRSERDRLLGRFFAAAEGGDVDGLIRLLADDVVVHGDGGGKVPQWYEPIVGPDKVARLFARLGSQVRSMGATFERHEMSVRWLAIGMSRSPVARPANGRRA